MKRYKWSSYRDYLGQGRKLTDTKEILSIISNSREAALMEFCRFINENMTEAFMDIAE